MTQTTTYDERQSEAIAIETANLQLANLSARDRVAWSMRHLPGQPVLTSSFGAQSAVSLHMISNEIPGIPVVLIDTGYLFTETYRFIDELVERLGLNLQVYRSTLSPAWQEARYGRRWLEGVDGLDAYHRDTKIEPMQRALNELAAGKWFAGLRRDQAQSRQDLHFVQRHGGIWKIHPIADWTDRDIYGYLQDHGLPYHPLWEKGYVSIGDVHTTRSLSEVVDPAETRFFGLKRECGLHDDAGDAATAAA